MWWKIKHKESIKAVIEEDLETYLKSLGLYQQVLDNNIKCRFCGEKITFDNLQAIIPLDDKIYIVCDRYNCMEKINYGKD